MASDRDGGRDLFDWLFSRTGIATAGAVAVLGFLIYTGHSAHLLGALPWLLILACPLMHVFMHGGHGSHHHHRDDGEKPRSEEKKETNEPPRQHHP